MHLQWAGTRRKISTSTSSGTLTALASLHGTAGILRSLYKRAGPQREAPAETCLAHIKWQQKGWASTAEGCLPVMERRDDTHTDTFRPGCSTGSEKMRHMHWRSSL